MERTFRIIKRIFLYLTLLLLLAVLVIGVVSTVRNWQGFCEEAGGGILPCTSLHFALREMFWATFLFIPFFFIAGIVYLGMSLAQFFAALVKKRRRRE